MKLKIIILLNFFLLFAVYDLKSHKPSAPTYPPYIEHKQEREKQSLVFLDVPIVSNRINENSYYADIINHCRNPVLNHDRDTNAHESIHMLNSAIRNAHSDYGRNKINAFYVLNGKGYVLKEPNIRKNIVASYIPEELREHRFKTYITGQTEWDDRPLYLVDEHIAYISGAMVSVQDVEAGRHNGEWSDAVCGCLEFSIYSVGLAMAVKEHDPEYWKTSPFREFVLYNLKRSFETYQKGSKMKEFKWDTQDKLYQNLLNNEKYKQFMQENFEGIWFNTKI